MKENIELGQTYVDRLTGFSGVVTALTTYLHSTPKAYLEPNGMTAGGKPKPGVWMECGRLEVAPAE